MPEINSYDPIVFIEGYILCRSHKGRFWSIDTPDCEFFCCISPPNMLHGSGHEWSNIVTQVAVF